MATDIDTGRREIVLIEEAHIRPMMGLDILEPLPSARIPYRMVDPYILVHEAVVPITPERASLNTRHPHRGFDNLWYVISGSASTGHSTGPGGAIERATGRRIAAEAPDGPGRLARGRHRRGRAAGGQGRDTDARSAFWVNLARKDKHVGPSAQLLQAQDVPVRHDGDAIVRVWSGRARRLSSARPGSSSMWSCPTGGGCRQLRTVRVQRLRIHVGRRGEPRHQRTPSEPLAGRGSRTRRCARRGECAARDEVRAHGRQTVRRSAHLQRTVRGLIRPLCWMCRMDAATPGHPGACRKPTRCRCVGPSRPFRSGCPWRPILTRASSETGGAGHPAGRDGIRDNERKGRGMCRWLAYSGSPILLEELLYKPEHSLIDQSRHSRMGSGRPTGMGSVSVGTPRQPARPPARSATSVRPGATATSASLPATSRLPCSWRTSGPRPGRPFSRPTATLSATGAGYGSTTA